MQKYSDFFKTLHDEQTPAGYLGRGAHYSVFRAVAFHDPAGVPLSEGQFADFAVVWDEDHDTRVMEPVEEIYRRGLLSSFTTFGESKGVFTAILADNVRSHFKSVGAERVRFLTAQVKEICHALSDPWASEVDWDGNSIIQDDPEKVRLYLQTLKMLWRLGAVALAPWVPFNPVFLKKVVELDLSVRSTNCLKNDNIIYIGDLVQKNEAEMLRTPNFGRKPLNEIKEVLAQLGLHLGMEVPGWPPDNIDELANEFAKYAS